MSKLKILRKLLKGNLGLMTFTSGLWNFAGQMVWPFMSLYYISLGASYFELGLISSLWSISRLFPLIIGGYLTDKFGRRKIVIYLSFILSIINIFYALAPNWIFLIPVILIDGFASGLREPAFMAIIADSINAKFRALGFAIWDFGPSLFGVFSPYIAGMLIDKIGLNYFMKIAFIIVFIFSFMACLMRLFFLKETLKISSITSSKFSIKQIVISNITFISTTRKEILLFLFSSALASLIYGAAEPFFVVYAVYDVIRISASNWGLITMLRSALRLIFTPIIAYISDKIGRIKLLIFSLIISSISIVFFIFSISIIHVAISISLYSIFTNAIYILMVALLTDLIKQECRGRAVAIRCILSEILMMIGSLTAGYTYENVSKTFPFIMSSLTLIIVAFLVTISIIRIRRE